MIDIVWVLVFEKMGCVLYVCLERLGCACMPSDAFSQHLLSYLRFSYLGCWVSLHGCSSKVQLLLLTLDEGYLLRAAPPDLSKQKFTSSYFH